MANKVTINGDHRQFTVNADLKKYALIDAGFKQTKRGNYVYEHPLYNDSPYNAPTKLKITLRADLATLTMVITDRNGLQKVNIFKNKQLKPTVELLNFILKDLIERKIITEVKD